MMGTLSSRQRQLLIDIVTSVVMHDACALKRAVLQVAQPRGEVSHGAILEMCESMSSEYSGSDFGDFNPGDLPGTILSGLQDENFKIDPFLTNLVRGIVAMEGTIKTLSPNVNILNDFTSKVNTDLGFRLNLENPGEMNPGIAMKLLHLFQGVTDSSVRTAETLDMPEKGQIRVRTDFSFEEKTLNTVNRITGYLVRALIIVAVIIASSLLCTIPTVAAETMAVTITFRAVGFIGYLVSLFFAWRLFRNIRKGK